MRVGKAVLTAALCASLIGAVQTAKATPPLLGVSWQDGKLFDVDPITGLASNPRSTGVPNLTGVAWDFDNSILYTMMAGGSATLYSVDPITGMSTSIGVTGKNFVAEGDIAWNPVDGSLWGLQDVMPFNSRELFTINPANGDTVVAGNVPTAGDLSAMAFDASGTLWVLDTSVVDGYRLLTLNLSNAQILTSVNLSQPLGAVAGMSFDPDTGVLYVADGFTAGTNTLYTLNTATGVLTTVGTGLGPDAPAGLSGLSFYIPEPATLALMLVGGMGLIRRKRR